MAIEGSGSGAIKAGSAFVEIFLADGSLRKGLERARQRVQQFGASLARIGAGVGAAGAAIVAPLTAAFHAFAAGGDSLNKMAARTNTTVEALSELKFAAEQSGQGIEQIEPALSSLNAKITQARLHNVEAIRSFQRLGVAWQDLANLSPDKQLEIVAEAVKATRHPADQAAVAMQLLGGAGQQLLPLLQGGAKGVQALRKEARDLGITMGTATAQSAADAVDALNRFDKTVKAAKGALGSALAPALTEVINLVVPFITGVVKWIRENKGLVATIFAVGVALVTIGGALTAFGLAVTGVTLGLSAMGVVAGAVFGLIKGAVLALVSPLGVAAAAVGVLGYLFVTQTETGKRLAGTIGGELSNAWVVLRDTAVGAWGGISSALKRGDLETAGKIAMAGLYVVWRQGILLLQEAWYGLKDNLVGAFSSGLRVVQDLWTNTTAFLQRRFTEMLSNLLGRAASLASLIGADSLADSLSTFAEGAKIAGREIEQERRQTIAQRKEAEATAADDRRRRREEAIGGSQKALADARGELAKLLAEEAARAEVPKPGGGPKLPGVSPALATQLGVASSGTFAAQGIGQALGSGQTIAQQQLTATKEVRDAVKEATAAIKNGGGVFGEG